MTKQHLVTLRLHHRIHTSASDVNVNTVHAESLSRLDHIAQAVTDRIGTFGMFLLIAGWTVCWLGWNLLAPRALRFDPAPAFVFWLFVSNLIQICLMPLILISGNLQARHSELMAEQSYRTNQENHQMLQEIRDMVTDRATTPVTMEGGAHEPPHGW